MTLASLAKNFINLIYPLHCAICKKPLDPEAGGSVCRYCILLLKRVPEPCCVSCGKPVDTAREQCKDCLAAKPAFSIARSACLYEGAMKDLIRQFKYHGKLSLENQLSDILIKYLKDNPQITEGVAMVTFVPIGGDHMRKRGFNQSKALARNVSKALGLRLADCVDKIASTRSQNELSREDRLVNLSGAFRAKNSGAFYGLSILMVDDVMTTGTTLNECAKTLLRSGAGDVRCVTLARGS